MYKDAVNPASILIVKTSSLGDIIQAFNVLDDLHNRFPLAAIDWAVEASLHSIVAAHPLVRRAIPLDIKGRRNLWSGLRALRRDKYDLVFDLQGNCKSGLITFLSRSRTKVGYGLKSVREFPNIFATHVRFNISKEQNIRHYYLQLIEQYFGISTPTPPGGVRFHIDTKERQKIAAILSRLPPDYKIMVCPGSKWINKQLPLETLAAFLKKIENASFFLIWGDETERNFCTQLQSQLSCSMVVDKLPIPTWQNLMSEMHLIIAVDSSALHLCGTTSTPSFSIFGPTSPHIFKPLGSHHLSLQGPCPYNRTFAKQCPLLRTCPTGACIRHLTADDLFNYFKSTDLK
jgi:heptosyltransferase-1